MKILAVKFKNLNSLKGVFEIRFDSGPLAEAGLFAITGPTGAGKTTLLDAITVALYNRVPRHQRNIEELMTRHTGECFSEIEFEAGDKKYRALWQLKRARGLATGALQPDKVELSKLDTGEILGGHRKTETLKIIEQVCGLDYEQFLRSVMLAQGEFALFLKADTNERSRLLEQMTDTAVFSRISAFVFDKTRQTKKELDDTNLLLGNFTTLLPEEILTKQSEKNELFEQGEALKKADAKTREEFAWLQLLEELRKTAENLNADWQTYLAEAKAAEPLLAQLKNHERALPAMSLFHLRKTLLEQEIAHKNSIELNEKKLPQLVLDAEKAAYEFNQSKITLEDAETAKLIADPIINEVLEIDQQLAAQQQLVDKLLNKLAIEKTLLKKDEESDGRVVKELKDKLTEQEINGAWLKVHETDAALVEIEKAFTQQAFQLNQSVNEGKKITEALSDVQNKIKQNIHEIEEAQGLVKTYQQITLDLTSKLQEAELENSQLLNGADWRTLQERVNEIPHEIAMAEHQNLNLTQQEKLKKRLAIGEEMIKQVMEDTSHLNQTFSIIETRKKEAKEHLETLELLVRQQLMIQKYEADRSRLKPNEPCPLCGATHHPYVLHTQSETPDEIQEKLNRQKELYGKLEKEFYDTQNTLAAKQSSLDNLLQTKLQLKKDLDILITELNANTLKTGLGHLINNIEDLIQFIAEKNKERLGLQTKINRHHALVQQLEKGRLQIEESRKEEEKQGFRASQYLNQKKESDQLLIRLQKEKDSNDSAIQQTLGLMNEMLLPFGLHSTLENTQTIKLALIERINNYEKAIEAKNKLTHDINILHNKQSSIAENITALNLRINELEIEQKQLEEEYDKLNKKRIQLFGAKNARLEKDRLETELEQCRRNEKTQQGLAQKANQALALAQQELLQQQKQLNDQQALLTKNETDLQEMANKQGFESISTMQAALISNALKENIELTREKLVQKGQEIQTLLARNKDALQKQESLNKTKQDANTLQLQLQQIEQQQAECQQQMGAIARELEHDAQRKTEQRELVEEQERRTSTHNRWKALNELIGSADGNKFRTFAQGLTLRHLTLLANRHLQHFNPRYHLVKKAGDNLEIEITDDWQAGISRSINSLSGGETFLVSLSLALGLSDLASNKVQIKSLFIDEGFGTLDAETLDTAMDALENLNSQGKSIGIISHVEALKERIGTQVQVIKKAGGYNTVLVNGVSAAM